MAYPEVSGQIAVEILLFFSLKNKRLQRIAGNSFSLRQAQRDSLAK